MQRSRTEQQESAVAGSEPRRRPLPQLPNTLAIFAIPALAQAHSDLVRLTAQAPTYNYDPGLLVMDGGKGAAQKFIAAITKHRYPERETDPPMV